jgi:DNA-binding GntR family transcriptional regulator
MQSVAVPPFPDLGGVVERRKSSQIAAELITKAIVDGRLRPGARLKEDELARTLGISRTPVREALLMLRARGLVDMSPNRGATVRTYDADQLDDLYGLRAVLEGHAARLAAQRATEEQLAEIDASCTRFDALVARKGDDFLELVAENARFHSGVLDAAGSRRLADMLETVMLPLAVRAFTTFTPAQLQNSAQHHRDIAAALAARQGERADALMREHIGEARDVLVGQLRAA